MIKIDNNQDCCGCSACAQKCPMLCIVMKEDSEGFSYPVIDVSLCIDCHLCEKVCPFIVCQKERQPLLSFAAKNKDDAERNSSSSGGVFIALAKEIIHRKGVVFGAVFNDDYSVSHIGVDTIGELEPLMRSKYVQSNINNAYIKVKEYLEQERDILFVGTPCQVAGLRNFLGKEYEKLLLVDVVCHGTPSPGVWHRYLDEAFNIPSEKNIREKRVASSLNGLSDIASISFRDKRLGWKKYSFVVCGRSFSGADGNSVLLSSIFNESIWGNAFVQNLFLRPACHACKVKSLKSGSDLTIADYWGIEKVHPLFDDDKGVSAVIVNTERGGEFITVLDMELLQSSYADVVKGNSAIVESWSASLNRTRFFSDYKAGKSLIPLLCKYTKTKFCLGAIKRWLIQYTPSFLKVINSVKSLLHELLVSVSYSIVSLLSFVINVKMKRTKILLIPADGIVGGFGEDIMVAGFLEGCKEDITIFAQKVNKRSFIEKRPTVNIELGLTGHLPYFKIFSLLCCHTDVYIIGADVMDGVYENNKMRFHILYLANRMGVKTHLTGFSIRENPSEYFIKNLRKISSFMEIKARDIDSYERMCRYVPENNIKKTTDIAFLCGHSKNEINPKAEEWIRNQRANSKRIIAFCPNIIQAKEKGLEVYLNSQILLLREFVNLECSVLFLYHDLRKYALGINDKELSKMISYYFPINGFFIDDIMDGYDLKSVIGFADFTVTGRMHFGISGYTLGLPMFGVCYYNKFEGVQKQFGIDVSNSLINYDRVETELFKVPEFMLSVDEYKVYIQNHINEAKELAKLNY